MTLSWVHAIIWPVLNALVGILFFEWCWYITKPIRNIDESRDSRYPAFRRYDAVKWRRWKYYPGAVTLLPLRMTFAFMNLVICFILLAIVTIGADLEKPLTGCRKRAIACIYWTCVHIERFLFCYRYSLKR